MNINDNCLWLGAEVTVLFCGAFLLSQHLVLNLRHSWRDGVIGDKDVQCSLLYWTRKYHILFSAAAAAGMEIMKRKVKLIQRIMGRSF